MTIWLLKQLLTLSGLFNKAMAQAGNPGGSVTLFDPLNGKSFTDVVGLVTDFLITIGIPIAVVMVLVGGFQMLVSRGSPENISKGKKTITYAAIGLAVILAAKSIVTLIQNVLGAK